jgi:hypothetical protein
LLVLPIVDVYYAGRDEKTAVIVDLESARSVAAGIAEYETRVAEKVAQLKSLEVRTLNDESLPDLRGKLVDLAKEARCSIRRLNVGITSSRPWKADENPIMPKPAAKSDENASPFVLEWRPINLSLSGTGENLRTLIDKIATSGMFVHTKSMEMYPSSPARQSLTLDMELWYFTLTRRG